MSHLQHLNNLLATLQPAAWQSLSQLGRDVYLPKGVPVQAMEARNCEINATIGQLTDDFGRARPVPVMAEKINGIPAEELFLYTPQGGRTDLRALWQQRIMREINTPISLPVACCGLTHGLSTAADLFIDEETTVILPRTRWGNYDLVFSSRRRGKLVSYDIMKGNSPLHREWTLNIEGIGDLLSEHKGRRFLVLNIPSNPTGYTPTEEEVDQLVSMLQMQEGPLVILLDEAYHGMEWEDSCYKKSLMAKLAKLDPEKFLVIKVDGTTKELFFFGGRLAFISFNATGEAAKALEEKACASIRSTTSAIPSPSQALVMAALTSPDLEQQLAAIRSDIASRYRCLKRELEKSGLDYWPFNSAFFALVPFAGDTHVLRRKLIADGLGVVAMPAAGALRLSYSTVPEAKIPQMVEILQRHY